MTPDPERENALRERVQVLLAAAPEPDPARLDAALQSARLATRRRQRGRRALAWLAAAMLLGAGAATAGWWLGTGDPRTGEPAQEDPDSRSRSQPPANDENGANDAEQNGSGGSDSGLIYQGVE